MPRCMPYSRDRESLVTACEKRARAASNSRELHSKQVHDSGENEHVHVHAVTGQDPFGGAAGVMQNRTHMTKAHDSLCPSHTHNDAIWPEQRGQQGASRVSQIHSSKHLFTVLQEELPHLGRLPHCTSACRPPAAPQCSSQPRAPAPAQRSRHSMWQDSAPSLCLLPTWLFSRTQGLRNRHALAKARTGQRPGTAGRKYAP